MWCHVVPCNAKTFGFPNYLKEEAFSMYTFKLLPVIALSIPAFVIEGIEKIDIASNAIDAGVANLIRVSLSMIV